MMIRYFAFFVLYVPIFTQIIPRAPILNIQFTSLFFYLLLLIFFIYSCIKRDFGILSIWAAIITVYSGVVVASVSWAPLYSYDGPMFKFFFYSLFIPLATAVMAMKLLNGREKLEIYIKYLFPSTLIFALINIFQLALGKATYEGYRAAGALGNANSSAIWLVFVLPSLLWGIENKVVSKLKGNLVLGFLIGGILCTISRKGIVTLFLTFFIYYALSKQFKKIMVSGIVFFFLLVIVAGYSIVSHRFSEKTLENQFKGRSEMVSAGLDMFKDHPLRGLGYKGFYENIMSYRPTYTSHKLVAHNNYITALVNYGLIGFIPLICIFLFPLYIAARVYFSDRYRQQDPDIGAMAIICISCVVPFMLSAYFAGSLFYSYAIMPLVFAQMSFVVSRYIALRKGGNVQNRY